ncbi:MAG TPA: hypothetical protein VLA34_05775, partial [Candidatus Krumholzibacterium sp.]|nr:hypothetical protein [Candidatus Krumholzibacterium sp.]
MGSSTDIQPAQGSDASGLSSRCDTDGRLSAVIEIASTINSQLELDQLLSAIAKQMSKIIDFDLGCVAIFEKSENCLYIRDVYRKDGDSTGEGRYVPLDETNLVGWVAINKKPVLRTKISEDKRFSEIMVEDALESDM